MSRLICGVNEITNSSFDGMAIREAKNRYGQVLNIPGGENLTILVNDSEVTDWDYRIRSFDTVEFVKTAGEKGV